MPLYPPPGSGGGGGAVTSVAGRVGDVSLTVADVPGVVRTLILDNGAVVPAPTPAGTLVFTKGT